ncbi:MAG: hypothetical protein ACRC28_17095 [Clostridium sp.]|uniref:hypothetical protein n=1 Tax=Clostridium sp. TaxID=1506 RepID=UPI003F33A65F
MFDNFNESCTVVGGFDLKTFKPGTISKQKQNLKLSFDTTNFDFKTTDIKDVKECGELSFRTLIRKGEFSADGYLESLLYDTYYDEGMDGASFNSSFLIFTLEDNLTFIIRTSGSTKILKKLGFWKYEPFEEPTYTKAQNDFLEAESDKITHAKYALSGMYLGGTTLFQARQEHLIYLTEDEVVVNRQQFLKQSYGEETFLDIPYKSITAIEVVSFETLIPDAKVGINGYFGLLEIIGRMDIAKNPNAYKEREALKITYTLNDVEETYLLETNRIGKEEIQFLKSVLSK